MDRKITLNDVQNNWLTYFPTTCNQLSIQKLLLEDLLNSQKCVFEPRAISTLENKILQEKKIEEKIIQ